jgi:hypothetical protein
MLAHGISFRYMDGDMTKHVCVHLRDLEDHLVSRGCAITSSGQAWSSNCRLWITFDAVLDCDALRKRLKLADCVNVHENDDPRSGREKGLVCSVDHDGIVGLHPLDGAGRKPVR